MTDIKELHRKGWALGLRANKLRDYINEHMAPAPASEPEPEPVVEPEPEVKPKATKKKKASKKKASSK